MAKLAPRDLAQVLGRLPKQDDPRIVVGYEHADDAGVFRLDDETLLVQTLDFFTPIVDDPGTYGRIAALNSLNDIYAMGGEPLTALSIVCFPQSGDWNVLGDILAGGQGAMMDEKVVVLGGHSIDDPEIKFGYSVTGIIRNHDVVTNAGAKPGDSLILTKPIGTGVVSTAIKNGIASAEASNAAIEAMTESARTASKLMVTKKANACTDITGFGLLGHAFEMASASSVTLRIESEAVPLLPNVTELVEKGMLTRGDRNNREYIGDELSFGDSVSSTMQSVLLDPQTAGGLLISLPAEAAREMISELPGCFLIGEVEKKGDFLIEVA